MKMDLVLQELHRRENDLAQKLLHASERHKVDHDVYHLGRDLAGWSQRHVRDIAEAGRDFGLDLDPEPDQEHALPQKLREKSSELFGRRSEPGLLLLVDLRELYTKAAGLSVDWELLAQAAQGVRNRELLALTERCHPETLRQMKWANAKLKESATQILIS